jgi:hypothetical protein
MSFLVQMLQMVVQRVSGLSAKLRLMSYNLLVLDSQMGVFDFMGEIVLSMLISGGTALVLYVKRRRKRISELIECRLLKQAASRYV